MPEHSDGGAWIQTFNGGGFWPLDPRPEDVRLEDVAHALALKCRYNGHCRRFYSVAQHSVLMADWLAARPGVQWWEPVFALLHDSGEAYLADIPSPVKGHTGVRTGDASGGGGWESFADLEDRVVWAVTQRLCPALPETDMTRVGLADKRILIDEVTELFTAEQLSAWTFPDGLMPLGVPVEPWEWQKAELEYLAAWNRHTAGVREAWGG